MADGLLKKYDAVRINLQVIAVESALFRISDYLRSMLNSISISSLKQAFVFYKKFYADLINLIDLNPVAIQFFVRLVSNIVEQVGLVVRKTVLLRPLFPRVNIHSIGYYLFDPLFEIVRRILGQPILEIEIDGNPVVFKIISGSPNISYELEKTIKEILVLKGSPDINLTIIGV